MLGCKWIPAFAGMTAGARSTHGNRSDSVSFNLQQYFDAGGDRADLGALGASRAAVLEDDEGGIVVSRCWADGLLGAGFEAGAAAGAGVRHSEG